MRVLVISGANFGFAQSANVILEFLSEQEDLSVALTEDKSLLASSELGTFDVCVYGSGFTRAVRQADGKVTREPELTPEEQAALFRFVQEGKGFVGVHGTGWWIGGEVATFLGGHANWHPPGTVFNVHIEDGAHPVTEGIADFEVEDEIYICAYDPTLHVLASAQWQNGKHPMAWAKSYGNGRIFYTTLGHGPGTFRRPAMRRLMTQGLRWAGSA